MTVGTGELLKLAGDYDLFSKTGHAQRARVPIKTKLTVQDTETFRTMSLGQRPVSRVFRKFGNEGQ